MYFKGKKKFNGKIFLFAKKKQKKTFITFDDKWNFSHVFKIFI